jgi:hypothetical protein
MTAARPLAPVPDQPAPRRTRWTDAELMAVQFPRAEMGRARPALRRRQHASARPDKPVGNPNPSRWSRVKHSSARQCNSAQQQFVRTSWYRF